MVVVYGEKRREELFPILEQRENKVEVKEQQQPPPKTVMEIGDNKRQLKDTVAKLERGHQMDEIGRAHV